MFCPFVKVTFTAADSWFPGFLLPCVKVSE